MLEALDRLVTSLGKKFVWLVIVLLIGLRPFIARFLTGDWNMTLDAVILWGHTIVADSDRFGAEPVFMMVGYLVLAGVLMDIVRETLRTIIGG